MSMKKIQIPSLKRVQRLITTLIGEGSKTKVDRSKLQPMVYPYSRTAAFVQHPYVHQYNNGFAAKELVLANIILMPVWIWITSKVCSPENYLAMEKAHKEDHIKLHKKEWEI